MHPRTTSYIHLAAQSILFFFPAIFVGMSIHEFGHGIGAWLAGASFNGVHVTFFGANAFTSGQETVWQRLLITVSGSTLGLLVGLVIYFALLPRLKRWSFAIFSMYLGFVTLIDLPRNMLFSGVPRPSGDFYGASQLLDIPAAITGVVGALLVVVVVYLYSRVFARSLSTFFPFDTYRHRLLTFSIFLTLPALVYAIGAALTPFGPRPGLAGFALIFALAVVMNVAMAFVQLKPPPSLQADPKVPSATGAIAFALALFAWLGLFGTRTQPKGIVWVAPKEQEVISWNLIISVLPDLSLKADFLMRPTVMDMFWQKQRLAPPNWQLYDTFVHTNVAAFIPSARWKVIERVQDDTISYSLLGVQEHGARRITLVSSPLDESQNKVQGEDQLSINCDSVLSRYAFCRLEIHFDTSLVRRACEVIPTNAPGPIFDGTHTISFSSQTLQSARAVRCLFAHNGTRNGWANAA